MSGTKRRTNYRKSVTKSVMDDYPLPEEDEVVARINHSRGGNIFEVLCQNNEVSLALLPTKFKKLIWMKRGDFVILSQAAGDIQIANGKSNGVRYLIQHILKEDQIKYIKKEGKWPENWPAPEVSSSLSVNEENNKKEKVDEIKEDKESMDEDDEYNDDSDDFADMGENTNVRQRTYSE
ncbi:hypothetical protein WA158_000999 [Blastocystis sp. Blastoise]